MVRGAVQLKDGSMLNFEKDSMPEAIAYVEKWHGETTYIELEAVEVESE